MKAQGQSLFWRHFQFHRLDTILGHQFLLIGIILRHAGRQDEFPDKIGGPRAAIGLGWGDE